MTKDIRQFIMCILTLLAIIALPLSTAAAGNFPIHVKTSKEDIDIEPDGSYVDLIHEEIQATTDGAARNIAQRAFTFVPSLANIDIVEAHTHKMDGRDLPVDPSTIHAQLTPGIGNFPMFNDLQQKIVIFPDVSEGDTIVFTVKYRNRGYFPKSFMYAKGYDRTLPIDVSEINIRAPKSMPLYVEAFDVSFEQRNEGDKYIYYFSRSAPNALADDPAVLSPFDRLPRLFVSSFADYDAFGRAYAGVAEGKAQVTPRVRDLAEEITAGITDRRQQAEKLYDWVSGHVRYVAVFLGTGAVEPHSADTVLANGYGDCKDHAVLYAALLKAKGIDSDFVLVNADNSYHLSGPPTLAQLNHAITYLPEFSLYADTTSGLAPFGILPISEYGKPVVHALTVGSALRHIPILPVDQETATVRTSAKLTKNGMMIGDTVTRATGPFAITLRATAQMIEAKGPEAAAKAQLHSLGLSGTGTFAFAPPNKLAREYTISGHFELLPRAGILMGNSFAPTVGLILLKRPGNFLLGPLYFETLPDTEATPCYAGRQIEELSLELPPGRHIAKLPAGTKIDTPAISYESQWSLDGQTVRVHREMQSRVDQPLCTGSFRQTVVKVLAEIRADYESRITLVPDDPTDRASAAQVSSAKNDDTNSFPEIRAQRK